MKALVFQKIGDIRMKEVPDPKIENSTDAIVRLTSSAICGTDLHFVRGTFSGMKKDLVLGHEGVGILEEVGSDVKTMKVGDRVVVCSTIACGTCDRCHAKDYSQCENANPNGKFSGTAFFGGPEAAGSFDGLQAERARIPYADTTLVKLPDEVTDDQAIMLSDIFPTAYFGAKLADVGPEKTVAVFGCGPVGQFAILSAKLLGARTVFAIDEIPSRLEAARKLGAETINYNEENPVERLKTATGGAGVDCAIDAVGVDAKQAHDGPAAKESAEHRKEFEKELKETAPKTNPDGENWQPGDGPTQALRWAVEALRGAGSLGIIGVYPPTITNFPIGAAMNKNISVKMGNCPHRRYIPELIDLVVAGKADPAKVITQHRALTSAVDAYEAFDRREEGWIKVELDPESLPGLTSRSSEKPAQDQSRNAGP